MRPPTGGGLIFVGLVGLNLLLLLGYPMARFRRWRGRHIPDLLLLLPIWSPFQGLRLLQIFERQGPQSLGCVGRQS
jgi:hypothetical protein